MLLYRTKDLPHMKYNTKVAIDIRNKNRMKTEKIENEIYVSNDLESQTCAQT